MSLPWEGVLFFECLLDLLVIIDWFTGDCSTGTELDEQDSLSKVFELTTRGLGVTTTLWTGLMKVIRGGFLNFLTGEGVGGGL